MLSEREELDLIRRAQGGDRQARDRLWVLFHGFAVAEARRLALSKGVDVAEAESEAAMAIPEAIERFDPGRKVRFTTYLTQRLRGTTTAVRRRERRQSMFDLAQFRPEPPEPEYREPKPPPSAFWSPRAIAWVKRVRRRNDRLIIKWLWFDAQPKSQAEIARRLHVSRSARCQRRRVLINRIRQIDPKAVIEE